MNTAKANKILILIATLMVCVIASIFSLGVFNAKAEAGVSGKDVFEYSSATTHTSSDIVTDENDNLVIPFTSGEIAKLKNKMVVEEFSMEVILPAEFTKITITLKISPFDKTKTSDVENKLEISKEDTQMKAVFNEGTETALGTFASDTAYKIAFKIEDKLLKCFTGDYSYEIPTGAKVAPTDADVDYRVETTDKTVATVLAKVECSADCNLLVKSISQKNSDSKYKQTFATNEGKFTNAYPRYELNKEIINFTNTKNVMLVGTEYNVRGTSYAVAGGYNDENFAIKVTGADGKYVANDEKTLRFNAPVTDATISIVSSEDPTIVYESYVVDVVTADSDNTAPVYTMDATARANYVKAFTDLLYSDKDNGVFVALGSSQYLNLPSLENFVSDDVTPYSKLKYTVYYENATTSGTSSSMRIPLSAVGEYKFWVVFEDANGNKMDEKLFKDVDADDSNKVVYDKTDAGLVFTFSVIDNHPITVESASSQGLGYIDVSYTATAFRKSYLNATESYKLFYSEELISKDANGWKEIPVASSVNEDSEIDGFTYEEIQDIAYNGKLTFTPHKVGYYKIECTVTSNFSSNSASDSTIVFVAGNPEIVKPDSRWLQNNVWSVVFLSVGTVCLIGIIVLLCIKPKDKNED